MCFDGKENKKVYACTLVRLYMYVYVYIHIYMHTHTIVKPYVDAGSAILAQFFMMHIYTHTYTYARPAILAAHTEFLDILHWTRLIHTYVCVYIHMHTHTIVKPYVDARPAILAAHTEFLDILHWTRLMALHVASTKRPPPWFESSSRLCVCMYS